jgi:hypothetical protein
MINRRSLLAAAAGLALAGVAGMARAQTVAPKNGNAAAGPVSKVDAASKTFVVTNKKRGDTIVAWNEKTIFKKGPAAPDASPTDATAADLKVGERVQVKGTVGDGNKVTALQVVIGGLRKKDKPAAQ